MYNLLNRMPSLRCSRRWTWVSACWPMPLAGGLLSGKARQTPAGSRTREVEQEYEMDWSENRQLDDFAALRQEIGEPAYVVAIAWTLANPSVASAIVGVRKLEHLDGLERA